MSGIYQSRNRKSSTKKTHVCGTRKQRAGINPKTQIPSEARNLVFENKTILEEIPRFARNLGVGVFFIAFLVPR